MENRPLSSVDRAIDVLEYIYAAGGECTLTAAAQGLGEHKSAVHRALSTLKARGYVSQDAESGRYSLGPRLFVLGSLVGENMALVKALRPYAQRIRDAYGECVHITLPYPDNGGPARQLLAAKIAPPGGVLVVSPPVGSLTWCHASASGKCMLAFAEPEALSRYQGRPLPELTAATITDWNALLLQLQAIRQQGYATEDGETETGLSCVAAPCLGRSGHVWGVISISGPTPRIKALPFSEVTAQLRAAARAAV
jgi:DNA-binding IclR family transcriptional regulator